ncbi:hypothetical protein N7462_000215 [Penicillium macrosclerotiorum]|uniref:uncharacterized protein n=1 Tax=Penicillium macrosclerotiorum TaxID=303699 RepID=UPI002547C146|nr:uncharacterized protein N7462_000215 [Penicillium macrosclerotiorum]KAJ5698210.1 hypothetical protein N7462_000215 [Penicillium macrosclerotiorum]
MPSQSQNHSDSDEDIEFEDVPLRQNQPSSRSDGLEVTLSESGAQADGGRTPDRQWNPTLNLPQQRDSPITPGSAEETRLRERLSSDIDRINLRQLKTEMGMDIPETDPSARPYVNFAALARDVEHLVDMLWTTSTPSIEVEPLITLAGIVQNSLQAYAFDPHSTFILLHKFDVIFASMYTGVHPITGSFLPGYRAGHPLLTQTQRVRIRSLAEQTRYKVISFVQRSSEENDQNSEICDDESESDDAEGQQWLLNASYVFNDVLMLGEAEVEIEVNGS